MFCCTTNPAHKTHLRVWGVILLIVGIVYVVQGMDYIKVTLPNFWYVLLVLLGIMMAGCAGCFSSAPAQQA